MIEYKKIFDYFKNNLTFILLITYIISFINFYIYYKSFNISIFNYIDISDLIFFFFEYLFKILLIIINTVLNKKTDIFYAHIDRL